MRWSGQFAADGGQAVLYVYLPNAIVLGLFFEARQVFVDPTDFLRLFRFEG